MGSPRDSGHGAYGSRDVFGVLSMGWLSGSDFGPISLARDRSDARNGESYVQNDS